MAVSRELKFCTAFSAAVKTLSPKAASPPVEGEELLGVGLQGGDFLFGEELAVGEHFRPLERGGVVVGPDPLQIGVAEGGPGRRP